MQGWQAMLMRRTMKRARRAAVISRTTLAAAENHLPDLSKLAFITWNGISPPDTEAFERAWTQRHNKTIPYCRLLTICRLVPRKNIIGVLNALAQLRDQGCTEWRYSLVGDGPERGEITEAVERFGLTPWIEILGRVSDEELTSQYASADIFVHPQVSGETGLDIEGFGLTIADAMGWGIPVVVGSAGAPSEFVQDGQTGFVVDGHNHPALASVLRNLLESPELRSKVGHQARTWALANLSWQQHVERILKDPTLSEFAAVKRNLAP